MTKSEYQQYLASREWALLREQVRKRGGGKCERCLVGNHDQTHHKTYERIGRERLEDLQAVCSACHEFLSGKSDVDPAAPPTPSVGIFKVVDGGVVASCAVCGDHRAFIRCISVRAVTSRGSAAVVVRLDGACGHTWDLCFDQHKNEAQAWADIVDDKLVSQDEISGVAS